MDNEKLTKSKVWREIDKFTDTLRDHWNAYIAGVGTLYINGEKVNRHQKEYSEIPSYADLCKEFENIMPLKGISDYVFDTNDIEIAKSLIEKRGLFDDLLCFTSKFKHTCKDEKLLSDCDNYFDLIEGFRNELDKLEMKLKKYNKDLVFKHRPDWAYWPEISKSIVGYEKALIRFTNPLPDNDKDFEKLKASVVVTHSSSGNDKDSSTSTDILSEIPDKIKKVFKKAVKAGYMQKQDNGIYHWNKPYTKKLLAYFGYCFYSYDLETYHWKLMEKVFGSQANYLATYFSKHYYKNYTPQTSEEKEIDKWFNS